MLPSGAFLGAVLQNIMKRAFCKSLSVLLPQYGSWGGNTSSTSRVTFSLPPDTRSTHESIKQLLGRWRKTLTERNKGHLSSWLLRVRHKSSYYSFIPRSPPPCLFPNSNSLASILRSHSFWVPRYPKILTLASNLFRASSQWSLS